MTCICRLAMIQWAPLTMLSSLDHSLILQQVATQIFALAATSMNLVAGLSGPTMDSQAVFLMVRPFGMEGNCYCKPPIIYKYNDLYV